jgi:glycosyltransferase involved in cell wall biosynthesis
VKQGCEEYWSRLEPKLAAPELKGRIILRPGHVPEAEVEVCFKAADVLAIPYVNIFQSGVPFLAYSFGLPVVATDVGALREDIVEGRTGFICEPKNPASIAAGVEKFFASDLFRNLTVNRKEIQKFANEKHSWMKVGAITEGVYRKLLSSG